MNNLKCLAILLLASLSENAQSTSSTRPPAAVPLGVLTKAADYIALVDIGSAALDKFRKSAKYEIVVTRVLRGQLNQICLSGPAGLKVGRSYLVFLQTAEASTECGAVRIAGKDEPYALEISTRSGASFVRMDNRKIIMPWFPSMVEIKNNTESREVIVGVEVPLETISEYVRLEANPDARVD